MDNQTIFLNSENRLNTVMEENDDESFILECTPSLFLTLS